MRKNYPNMSKLSILFLNRVGGIKLGELMVRTVMQFRKFKKVDYLKRAAMKLLKDPQRLVRYLDGYDDPNHFKQLNIDRLNGLVMGHNHKHAFEVFKIDGDLKFYLNCGAWKPVVERKSKNIFQKYFEIFYAIAKVESNDDFEITTSITNKLKKQEILDFD
jgi:UDP-2,3-diacylglucosamine pyrophosphatase LpxH